MAISFPENHLHPLFADQREYRLRRSVIDTGDGDGDCIATVVLEFQHQTTGKTRRFLFSEVHFSGIPLDQLTSYPLYVATTAGRQWASGSEVEVGDSDPGDAWFWARGIEELQ